MVCLFDRFGADPRMTRAGSQTLVSRRWLGRNYNLTASVAQLSDAACPRIGPRNGFRTLAVSQGVLDPSNQDTRRRSGKLWGLRHRTWTADTLLPSSHLNRNAPVWVCASILRGTAWRRHCGGLAFTSQNLSRLGAVWDNRIPNNTHSVRHPRAVLWLISLSPLHSSPLALLDVVLSLLFLTKFLSMPRCMASQPILTIDVLEAVIDQASDHTPSLRQLSPLCSTFLPRARFRLFTSIRIQTIEQLESSREFLHSRPWLPPLVRNVTLAMAASEDKPSRNFWLLEVVPVHLLTHLPNFRSWRMSVDQTERRPLSLHRSALSCCLKYGVDIQNLYLDHIAFDDMSDFKVFLEFGFGRKNALPP